MPLYFNGTLIERVFFNGVETDSIVFNGTEVFISFTPPTVNYSNNYFAIPDYQISSSNRALVEVKESGELTITSGSNVYSTTWHQGDTPPEGVFEWRVRHVGSGNPGGVTGTWEGFPTLSHAIWGQFEDFFYIDIREKANTSNTDTLTIDIT
ncbi:hypothetical protein [Paraferrimonas haliotis]|uniref:hypothetical protein n=1 Tax=Paraferrimonas haliotis TaxID=2013866 RepID=UPI000BA8EF1E|nr:hypothetical protein [Paraferrimonas haliotis]